MFDLKIEVRGSVNEILTSERHAGARAAKQAMVGFAQGVKTDWRGQVVGAGLGTRLGNSIRSQAYPQAGNSLNAAALVWTRASKIVAAFEEGAVIRAQNGFWLAIPTQAAGRGRGQKLTPGMWESKNGRELDFVYRPGRPALLVDVGRKAKGNVMVRRRVRGGHKLSEPRTFRNRSVVMFILVPQVTLRKRLNLYASALRLAGGMPQRIVNGWKS